VPDVRFAADVLPFSIDACRNGVWHNHYHSLPTEGQAIAGASGAGRPRGGVCGVAERLCQFDSTQPLAEFFRAIVCGYSQHASQVRV
jgi:hypothetical protein